MFKKSFRISWKILKKRISKFKPIIIYESTVYPGTTEEFCVSLIERESNLFIIKIFIMDTVLKGLTLEIRIIV